MQAVLDPLAMPLATDVVSGERADDPLYIPCIQRVQESLQRHGLLFVGDCKMAARETRAFIALTGDYYLCPLPQTQWGEGELEAALERVWSGEQALTDVFREDEHGKPKLIAQGYESKQPMSVEIDGAPREWTERRLVVRSLRHAQVTSKD
jgi:transposase